MTWDEYLFAQRKLKLEQVEFLGSGDVQVSIMRNGVLRDVTAERLVEEKRDIAEIEQILRDNGVQFDA